MQLENRIKEFESCYDSSTHNLTVKFGELTEGLNANSHTQLTIVAGVLVDKVESLEERFRSFSANTELRIREIEESPLGATFLPAFLQKPATAMTRMKVIRALTVLAI